MHARLTPLLLATVVAGQDKVDFAAQIQPIFAKRCYECHGPDENEGDLRLHARADAFPANEDHWVIRPGKPGDSELVRRLKLPKSDDEIMPAEGDPLSPEQIDLIERWIAEGAAWPESATPVGTEVRPPEPETFPIVLTDEQQRAVDAAVQELVERGAVAGPVARTTVGLDVNLSLLRPPATDQDLDLLVGVAPALVWLNLTRTKITDTGMATIAQCKQLRRLHLAQTGIGDAGVRHLAGLRDLTYLNLFGTKVSDGGLSALSGLASLQRIFLWQTDVTDAGVAAFQQALPDVQVDRGGYAEKILQVAQEQATAEAKEKAKLPSGIVNSKCPVSGEAIDAEATLVHDGRTIAFCCTKCRTKFEAEPGRFLPNLPPKDEAKK